MAGFDLRTPDPQSRFVRKTATPQKAKDRTS